MPWIENVAAIDVQTGFHHKCGENSMLIQILDICPSFDPKPLHTFKEIHKFEFLDLNSGDENAEECGISEEQAKQIVALLQKALAEQMNVVVHCTAGICRSGAVAEVGVILGFNDTERYRAPNLRVKHFMLKALGLTYDSNEKHYAVNSEIED